jgi:hypothetical protein
LEEIWIAVGIGMNHLMEGRFEERAEVLDWACFCSMGENNYFYSIL